jgi:hypothetical protein
MTVPAAALLFLFLQTTTGSIEGTVINSLTDKPIADAQVQANRTAAPMPGIAGAAGVTGVIGGVLGATPGAVIVREGAPSQLPLATTDANGHFVFPNLEPGAYLLRAVAEGYARQEFNARPGNSGMTAQVTLSAGALSKDTVFRLVPGGTVSGRVTGSSGEPLVNFEVTLLRSAYDNDGRKTFQQAGAAQTNDRGEYRLFWITPGRYYLSVAPSTRPLPGVPFFPGLNSNKYPRTFYFGVTDATSVVAVDVQPAVELSGIDFRLKEQATYRVRGQIVDSTGAQAAPRSVSISITPREPIVNAGISMSGAPYNASDGTFELRDVASGEYVVTARLPFNGRFEPGQPPPAPQVARALVDVGSADVDGVVLQFEPPVSISGRIRIDGNAPSAGVRANIFLRPAGVGPAAGAMTRPPQWNPDGTFRIDGIAPGEYRIDVCCITGQQPDAYVKEVRFGSVDALSRPLVITGSTSDVLEVMFGKGAGEIGGTVQGDSAQVGATVSVVLIPDRRERRDLYKFTFSDAAARFTFRGVPPGSYKVFAWSDIERNAWFDADVLRAYEQYGTPVDIAVSANLNANVKLIAK